MAQRDKIYQALETQTILASGITSLLVLVFLWDLLTVRKSRISTDLSIDIISSGII